MLHDAGGCVVAWTPTHAPPAGCCSATAGLASAHNST
jgi:hypothetical protein